MTDELLAYLAGERLLVLWEVLDSAETKEAIYEANMDMLDRLWRDLSREDIAWLNSRGHYIEGPLADDWRKWLTETEPKYWTGL